MEELIQTCSCFLTSTEARNEKCPRCGTPFAEADTPVAVSERINAIARMTQKKRIYL